MRRLEYLITSVRRSTDNVQTSAITDAEMIEWFNDGQKLIQNIIFKSNPKADIFKAEKVYTANASGVYDLPSDIYAGNAVSMVEVSSSWSSAKYITLDRVDEMNREEIYGYFIRDNQLILTGCQTDYPFSSLRITYFKKLPRFDKRWGKIFALTPGVSITLDPASFDTLASTVDDKICVVDSTGAVIRQNIGITSFSGNLWSTTDALTSVATNMFVCMGGYSSNVSGLVDECEPYLLDYVRKRLFGRNVYADGDKQDMFTAEQKDELIRLFQNNTKENLTPPITDFTHLEW